ncbi:MAG: hypothetical protein ACTS5I_02550 [Rhodanobacter sp.]
MNTTETTQPGLAPGSFWRVLSPKGQERVIIATVREALAEIAEEEKQPERAPVGAVLNPEQGELL